MSKVKVLSADVIAKIAAGEAVERPASVVKELVENSIDAGADAVEIHLKDAGKELIHIKDDGCGMAREDVEKIFQRHATSKISAIENLEELHSLGFRGEALYSIAAVSDVVMTTRTDGGEGWQIHVRGGERQGLQPAGVARAGTDIKISELFFNTPARRKFLKNNTSEMNAILGAVVPYTLLYPKIRFLLTHAGRALLDLSPAPDALDRVAAALNVPVEHLLETEQEYAQDGIAVRLILGNINIQRPTRNLQYIAVNRRPVESKNLSYNMNDVYRLILPPGVYGAYIVQLTLNPANVDVNIHPTKREVRLKDEGRIVSVLRRMTEYLLMQHGGTKEMSLPGRAGGGDIREGGLPAGQIIFGPGQFQPQISFAQAGSLEAAFRGMDPRAAESGTLREPQLFGRDNTLRSKFADARYVGAFLQKYLVFEAGESLLIVDQHAAQERIMFEKFRDQLAAARVESQPLLTPLLLKLTPQERIAWEELHEKLAAAGIETTQFDDDTIAVQSQPLLLKNIEAVVRSLLAGGQAPRMDPDSLARRACKASVVAGDKLDPLQADYQRKQLLECKDPFTCPHGRPTLIEMTQDFLDRQFLRS